MDRVVGKMDGVNTPAKDDNESDGCIIDCIFAMTLHTIFGVEKKGRESYSIGAQWTEL